jgi:hypothetical protein
MLAAAVIAQLMLFRLIVLRRPGRASATFAAVLSAVLWFAVGVAGRGIGFV